MNSLSWMIYAADVIPELGGIFFAGAITAGIIFALATMARAVAIIEDIDRLFDPARKVARVAAIIAVPLFVLSALIPSRTTIYMIAASEVAARSDTLAKAGGLVDPAIDLLRKKIDDALKAKP